uniref:BCL2 interacting protein 1 n=1 Tax=Paramormyrops kingsleyae TaxID=1676925 RepID=A0A3B3RFD5_9TELE
MARPQDVHVGICGQEIIKYDLELKALIQDIGKCSGQSELMDLNCKVKETFNQLRQRIQDMEHMAKEQDKESDVLAVLNETERHRKQMLSNQTAWRKANLACKLSIDNIEKDELFQGGDASVRQRKTTKESLAQTTSDITESLMNISRMMSQQVQQSEETMSSLGEWGPLEGLGRKPGANFVWRCPLYVRLRRTTLCLRLMYAGKTSTLLSSTASWACTPDTLCQ